MTNPNLGLPFVQCTSVVPSEQGMMVREHVCCDVFSEKGAAKSRTLLAAYESEAELTQASACQTPQHAQSCVPRGRLMIIVDHKAEVLDHGSANPSLASMTPAGGKLRHPQSVQMCRAPYCRVGIENSGRNRELLFCHVQTRRVQLCGRPPTCPY